jgi:hypothetical protein
MLPTIVHSRRDYDRHPAWHATGDPLLHKMHVRGDFDDFIFNYGRPINLTAPVSVTPDEAVQMVAKFNQTFYKDKKHIKPYFSE